MNRNRLFAIGLGLALMLPCAGLAENEVEILPTLEPVPMPTVRVNEYALENLEAYYREAGGYVYQTPSLTPEERKRLPELEKRYAAGERPKENILNVSENIHTAVITLPEDQYEGQSWFLLLPNREMTDDEMLGILDAFAKMGKTFSPDEVSWRNCMRGGGIESVRSFRGDEGERMSALRELYNRDGLRPEKKFSPLPDDGVGEVKLDTEDYNGLAGFRFRPARRLTDEELLEINEHDIGESPDKPEKLAENESLLRKELHETLGMPLSAKRGYETVRKMSDNNPYGDKRTAYFAQFNETGGDGRVWNGELDTDTGKLISAYELPNNDILEGKVFTDIRSDPFDPKWAEIAKKTVTEMRGDGGSEIDRVEAWCSSYMNSLPAALVRVWMKDGGCYRVLVAYDREKAVELIYNDAESIRHEDDYYKDMILREEAEHVVNA